jgi:hypothetical protein
VSRYHPTEDTRHLGVLCRLSVRLQGGPCGAARAATSAARLRSRSGGQAAGWLARSSGPWAAISRRWFSVAQIGDENLGVDGSRFVIVRGGQNPSRAPSGRPLTEPGRQSRSSQLSGARGDVVQGGVVSRRRDISAAHTSGMSYGTAVLMPGSWRLSVKSRQQQTAATHQPQTTTIGL